MKKKYTQYNNKNISNLLEQKILMPELSFLIYQGLKNYGNDLSMYQKLNIIHILITLMLLKIILPMRYSTKENKNKVFMQKKYLNK